MQNQILPDSFNVLDSSDAETNISEFWCTTLFYPTLQRLEMSVEKINTGALLYSMVNNAVEEAQYNLPDHKITKTGKTDLLVYGDKEKLQQVIVNLLSNAVKYSPGSPEVSITVGMENKHVNIIERHDGGLWAESEQGKGSIFYFTIPLNNSVLN
jgi:signal transduction histidine kinase